MKVFFEVVGACRTLYALAFVLGCRFFVLVAGTLMLAAPANAAELFTSEFENGVLKYVGSSDPHPGGGYVTFLGGELSNYYTPGDGCSPLSPHAQNVNMDNSADAQGGPPGAQSYALKTHYRLGCGSSFQKNTTIIKFPETQDVYVRFYQKWSANWIWPTGQQKFAKISNSDRTSSQNFYFRNNGSMRINYVSGGSQTSTYTPGNDDLASNASFDIPTGEWHEVQMHVKMSDPGQSNGELEYWIDGTHYFGLYNIENNNGSTSWLQHVELQHVYETGGSPKQGPANDMPTWMKNIVISTEFISEGCPQCPNAPVLQAN